MRKPRSYIVVLFENYYPRYRGGEIYERPGKNIVGLIFGIRTLRSRINIKDYQRSY